MAAPVTVGLICYDAYPANAARWKWQDLQGNQGTSGIASRRAAGVATQLVYGGYVNATSDPTGIIQILDPTTSASYPAKTSSGAKVTRSGQFLLDVTNPSLISAAVTFLANKCASEGWDGVYLDEVNEDFEWGGWTGTPTFASTDAAWRAAMQTYVSGMSSGLAAHGLSCYVNLGSSASTLAIAQPWVQACSGSSQEYWFGWDGANPTGAPDLGSTTGQYWLNASLSWATWVERSTSTVAVYNCPSVDPARIRIALAGVLLATEGKAVFSAGSTSYNVDGPWIAEYDQLPALGAPLGHYTQVGNVYTRQFEGGTVTLTASTTSSSSITLQENPVAATFSVTSRNAALDVVAALGTYISLHNATPPSSANELSGGSYARVATTWAGSSSGSKAGSQVVINVPAAATVAGYAVNTASTAGTITVSDAVTTSETYGSAGTYALTVTLGD